MFEQNAMFVDSPFVFQSVSTHRNSLLKVGCVNTCYDEVTFFLHCNTNDNLSLSVAVGRVCAKFELPNMWFLHLGVCVFCCVNAFNHCLVLFLVYL